MALFQVFPKWPFLWDLLNSSWFSKGRWNSDGSRPLTNHLQLLLQRFEKVDHTLLSWTSCSTEAWNMQFPLFPSPYGSFIYRVSKQVWDILNVMFWSSEKFASYVYKKMTHVVGTKFGIHPFLSGQNSEFTPFCWVKNSKFTPFCRAKIENSPLFVWPKFKILPFIESKFRNRPFLMGQNSDFTPLYRVKIQNSPLCIGSRYNIYPFLLGQDSKLTPFRRDKIHPLSCQNSKFTPFYWVNIL